MFIFSRTVKSIGRVQINCEGKPHFIHRTFAEYYVADCLVNCLTEGNNTSEQIQTFILKGILLEDDYRVIRVFVDGSLSKTKPTMEVLKQYGNQIQDLRTCDYLMLRNAAFEGNVNIIEFLLASVQAGNHQDKIKEMLLAKDEEGFTAWLISVVSNNTHVLEKLWEWAEKKLTEEELKYKLLLSGVIVYLKGHSAQSWWEKRLDSSMQCRKKIELLPLEMFPYETETVWHVAANLGYLKVLEKLWIWAKEKLTTEEIKKLLLANNKGRTAWHVAVMKGYLKILQKVWEWAEEKLTTDEINNILLLGTDIGGMTAWHWAALEGRIKVLHRIWEWAKENLTTGEIKI